MNIAINGMAIKDKEENKFTGSIKKYGKQLFSFIKSKVSSTEDAEDILQDVWLQFSSITNIDELQSISGWLYAVSKNRIVDFYRKKKTDRLEDYTYKNEEGDFQIKDILLLDTTANPELALFKEMFWEELMDALKELPENQRSVFIKNEIEDMTLQQIADEQGENLKTIISRKLYAIKYLRKKLQHLYNEINLS